MMEGASSASRIRGPGSRIPVLSSHATTISPDVLSGIGKASRVVTRSSDSSSTCAPGDNSGPCEKPVSGLSSMTIPIVLATVIPVVAALAVLIYLHRRTVKRQRQEDAMDPHKSLDFGLDIAKRSDTAGNGKDYMDKGKDQHPRHRQMSMDMNLTSPYLLPPGLHGSRESLHSLTRSIHQSEDPYRPVAHYATSDAGSIRSLQRARGGSSVYTASIAEKEQAGHGQPLAATGAPVTRTHQNSLPFNNPAQPETVHLKSAPPHLEADIQTTNPAEDPFRSPSELTLPDNFSTSEHDNKSGVALTTNSSLFQHTSSTPDAVPQEQRSVRLPSITGRDEIGTTDYGRDSDILGQPFVGRAKSSEEGYQEPVDDTWTKRRSSTPSTVPDMKSQSPPHLPYPSSLTPADSVMRNSENYDSHPNQRLSASNPRAILGDLQMYEERGRTVHRQPEDGQLGDVRGGLGVPRQDLKRLSVGMRPLPPDDMMDAEDPETRANRIRSFYKEYFDESKPDPMPPLPISSGHQQGGVDYYEDYDPGYIGDAPYYDPDTRAFVMPYAQPVARRAMTPPPSGSRFPGPRGPPRRHQGSLGGMSLQGGGFRGPSRPGSSASSAYGPRPGSSISNAWGRPRAGSAMSGSRFGGPRKPMPPPPSLTTLPNPSKLRDDNIAIFSSIDFAPPETFKDIAAGRPQSPAGERRPYQLNVPIHSPLVNAFEELPTLPSPHLLRKSSTFTGLDFAPPRKFTENDSRSETGSIRSNRSGISAMQLSAIRSGAGRVSRLPDDTIFSSAQMQQKLKPSWNMRD
ncbi:hypothetical protein VTK73DRAFT_10028 [Phialemonium thermophilum]|uniref:Uncharacterized protein n=1 Tax=Phialemonium thermophilum TaxID=223376 RepID=A0ABR3Y5F7_9PEZI